jgi:competence protein ComEA
VPDLPLTVSQRRLLAVLAACALAAALLLRHHTNGPSTALRVAPIARAAPARAAQTSIVVDVAGAVVRPGVYHLRSGSRVADAISRAGGLTRRAERTAVNLAAPISDGQQVLVAAKGASGGAPAAPGSPAGGPVSLSSATAEQLDALPGIGPVTAQKIIGYRQQHGPFTSVEALDAIPGIGPARIADLKGLVVP